MKKKIIGIFVCTLLIATATLPIIASTENSKVQKSLSETYQNGVLKYDKVISIDSNPAKVYHSSSILTNDEIDQHNGDYCGCGAGTYPGDMMAQSFVPTMNTLTKILFPIWRDGTPDTLKISIRSELEGSDLDSITVNYGQIGTNYQWYTFDFKDIFLNTGETYYIVWKESGQGYDNNNFYWGFGKDNPYPNGYAWHYDGNEGNWHHHNGYPEDGLTEIDFCFSQYGYDDTVSADLYCDGSLSWADVEPDTLVTDSFTVSNIGHSNSELDWKIESYPTWGNWTFTPSSGNDLKPSDGSVTIKVFVVAPDIEYGNFSGEVKVVNEEDSSDYCTIPVSLTTPKNKAININPLFLRFLENHPHTFLLLRHILKI